MPPGPSLMPVHAAVSGYVRGHRVDKRRRRQCRTFRRECPRIGRHLEAQLRPPLSRPRVEVLTVLELRGVAPATDDDLRPLGVVLRHREADLAHERMFG
jgi:hypothetical protein